MFAPHRSRRTPLLIASAILATAGTVLAAVPAQAATPPAPAPVIHVGSDPMDVAVAPKAPEAYVIDGNGVSIVSTRTHRLVATVRTGSSDQTALSLVKGGSAAYIGSFDQSALRVFNPATRRITKTITIGRGAVDIATATTPHAQYAYVAQLTPTKPGVTVVDVSTGKVVKRIPLAHGPQTATTTPNQSQVWVGSSYSGRITVINPRTQRAVRTISVPRSGPVASIAFGAQGKRAWVSGAAGVSLVSVTSGKTLKFLSAPTLFPGSGDINMGAIRLNPSGTTAMVLNSTFPDSPARGAVAYIGTQHATVQGTRELGFEPEGFGLDRQYGQTFVTNYADGTLSYLPTPR